MKKIEQKIYTRFHTEFNSEPILVFAPGRINIIGEHTDYNNGFVFPAAIDKGIVTAIQKSKSKFTKVIAVDVQDSMTLDLNNLSPIKNGGWKNYIIGVIAEIRKLKSLSNFNLVFGGDIPIGGGISSSAALENSVSFAINELFNLKLSKKELIKIGQRADHNYVGVKSGIMDQFASMFGEENHAIKLDCRSLEYELYTVNLKEYSLLLINTNVSHSLANSAYNDRRATCEKVAHMLNKDSLRDVSEVELLGVQSKLTQFEFNKAHFVIQENERVHLAAEAIAKNNLNELCSLLFQSHDGLQHLYEVSCLELDFLVNYAKSSDNILGARMMGGGFGGCTINIIESGAISELKNDIFKKYKNTFDRECSFYDVNISKGTHLIS